MKVSPARRAAFRILQTIENDGGLSSTLLNDVDLKLSPADRGLCHALVMGVLRQQIKLDRFIDALAKGKRTDPAIRIILRLGLFQLLSLERVPDHAVLNESVELARFARKHSAAGFVNAVLRTFTRQRPELVFAKDLDRLSVETSHPAELLERWIGNFGLEKAESLARANNEMPVKAFRATAKTDPASIARLLADGAVERSQLAKNGFVVSKPSPELEALAASGEIYFQDEGSQLVAEIAQTLAKRSFLDVCASPGSKTGAVALFEPDLRIVAGDVSSARLDTLSRLLERQGVKNVEVVRLDAESVLPFGADFDTVLLDAPCSGTGTIRHNPEIRYRVKREELQRFRTRQAAMIANAAKCVSPGGHLIYSTCSLEPEENEQVIEGFLSENATFELVPADVDPRILRSDGTVRTFPDHDGIDGFYAAVLQRKS